MTIIPTLKTEIYHALGDFLEAYKVKPKIPPLVRVGSSCLL